MKKTVCKVRGMSCAACSAAVEKTLKGQKGVLSASVNLASEEAGIEFDENIVSENDLSEAVHKAGYELVFSSSDSSEADNSEDEEAMRAEKRRKIRLITSLCFTIPLFVLTMGHMVIKTMPHVNGYIQLALCVPVLIAGSSFFTRGFRGLFSGHPNMDTLVAVGSGASFLYSLYNLFSKTSHNYYFEGVATIITLVMVGKYIEARSKRKAGSSIKALMKLSPTRATVISSGKQVEKDIKDVFAGDIVLVKPGEKIPADGTLTEGYADVNESMLTGESLPVHKTEGSAVFAGTINTNSSFQYEVTKTGADTAFAAIVRLVKEAQNSKAPISRLADKVSGVFVPIVMCISAVTFLGWMLAGRGFSFALTNAVSVLVIACPCSLGLATPIAIVTSTGVGARLGILFKNAEALENLGYMKNVMFDKTGTLTTGHPAVTEYSDDETLRLAAIAEQNSEHPFAKAVLDTAAEKLCEEIPGVKYFTSFPGKGIIARLNGEKIIAGNRALMNDNGVSVPDFREEAEIYVASGSEYKGFVRVRDSVRAESREAVSELKKLGLTAHMLTGDNPGKAAEIASLCGIEKVHSSLMPQDKLDIVGNTERSIMVGDGINDAPSLEKADIGVAMGNGTDVAISSADVVIMRDKLTAVPTSVRLSRQTIKNIKYSLFWAFVYNIAGIPIAAGVLTLFGGPSLNPMLCALCMSASSVSVVLNALRLRRFR